jgi:hypothetical protein
VAQDEGDRELDEADADVVGELGELVGCFELALVVGQVEVEPVGQALTGDRRGSFGGVLAVAARKPVGCQKSAWPVSCSDDQRQL